MGLKRKIGLGVALIVGTPLLALVGGLASLNTRAGEEAVRQVVERIVTGAIPGRMSVHTIDVIEVLSPPGIVRARAIDVRFVTPEGAEVIHVEHAVVEFDALALLRGSARLRSAEVNGGVVTLEPDGSGGTLIEAAFNGGAKGRSTSPGVDIELQQLFVRNMRFLAKLSPTDTLELREITGVVEVIVRAEEPGVIVKLDEIAATLESPRILGFRLKVIDATGAIRGAHDEVVQLAFHASVGDGQLRGTFSFQPDAEQPAKVAVHADGLLANIATMGVMLQDVGFGGKLAIELLGGE